MQPTVQMSVNGTDNLALLNALEVRRNLEKDSPRPDSVPVIYALYDPRTDLPFYVGATKNMVTRRCQHLMPSYFHSVAVAERIVEIVKDGFKPAFVILRETTIEEMAGHEFPMPFNIGTNAPSCAMRIFSMYSQRLARDRLGVRVWTNFKQTF